MKRTAFLTSIFASIFSLSWLPAFGKPKAEEKHYLWKEFELLIANKPEHTPNSFFSQKAFKLHNFCDGLYYIHIRATQEGLSELVEKCENTWLEYFNSPETIPVWAINWQAFEEAGIKPFIDKFQA